MLRFIIKRLRYDGACLNALHTFYETVDADVPALEEALRGGVGGGPDGDAFDVPRVIGVEVRAGSTSPTESQR